MNLSEQEKKYIETLQRDDQWTSSEVATRDYLTNQGVVNLDEFLKFQILYSGYELTIMNDPYNSFSCQLFSKKEFKKTRRWK